MFFYYQSKEHFSRRNFHVNSKLEDWKNAESRFNTQCIVQIKNHIGQWSSRVQVSNDDMCKQTNWWFLKKHKKSCKKSRHILNGRVATRIIQGQRNDLDNFPREKVVITITTKYSLIISVVLFCTQVQNELLNLPRFCCTRFYGLIFYLI
jgi:hypothetical protein